MFNCFAIIRSIFQSLEINTNTSRHLSNIANVRRIGTKLVVAAVVVSFEEGFCDLVLPSDEEEVAMMLLNSLYNEGCFVISDGLFGGVEEDGDGGGEEAGE